VTIRLYNTLTQKVEEFVPLEPGKVRIYVCGITPYDFAHAGHGRTYTTADVLVRYLRARGLEVRYCRNVTDFNDNILARAKDRHEDPIAFSKRMWDLADADLAKIGCAKPDDEPYVSKHIPEIVALIQALVDKGHAYVVQGPRGKDVYFDVKSFPPYGKLSHRNLAELLAGARIEVGDVKKDALDFALWKGCPDDEFGWQSPWGKGWPGWHIECSAMSQKYLGEHFDIHAGGMDLLFPHHENEVAQSEAVHGPDLARYWMHFGFLTVDKEKMSKSLGNFVTIRDVLARNDPEAFRYFTLGTHYRGPLNFDVEKLEDGRVVFPGVDEAERRMEYLYNTRHALAAASEGSTAEGPLPKVLEPFAKVVQEAPAKVLAALDNDLNAPAALAVIAELGKASNEIVLQIQKLKKDPAAQAHARALAKAAITALDACCTPLGLMQASYEDFTSRVRARRLSLRGLDEKAIDDKVRARSEARAAKDFAKADEIRKELAAMGVEVLDAGTASTWRITL
jgi:cysteinyl-tRNA synthetase